MSWEPEMAAQTLQKRWKNDAITMTPKLMETFYYKGRKAGQTHIVPSVT
jgi:hypothetical protein